MCDTNVNMNASANKGERVLSCAAACIEDGDVSGALEQLERLARDANDSSLGVTALVATSCNRLLDALVDSIDTAENLASYHRAKGMLELVQGEDVLAAAHLSVSLRFAASDYARDTLGQIRERNGKRFEILSYNDALGRLLAARQPIGPTQRVVDKLQHQLDKAKAAGDDATARQVAKQLYGLTLNGRYLQD